jgi:hypothetical protein
MVVSLATRNKLLLLPHVAILTQLQTVTDVIGFGGIVWLDLKKCEKNHEIWNVRFFLVFSELRLGKLDLKVI